MFSTPRARWCLTAGMMALLCSIAVSSVRADFLMIDNFQDPDPYAFYMLSTGDPKSETLFNDNLSAESAASQREVVIELTSAPCTMSAVGFIGVDEASAPEGKFEFGTGGAPGGSAKVTYADLDGFDLTNLGNNKKASGLLLVFDRVNGVQPLGLDVTVNIKSSAGGTLSYAGYVPNTAGTQEYIIPYAKFDADGEASFAAVDEIELLFNESGTRNVDFGLGELQATNVPEPSSAVLVGLIGAALMLFAGNRWRTRRRPA